jgi:mono/diheme cytochrome c family protein
MRLRDTRPALIVPQLILIAALSGFLPPPATPLPDEGSAWIERADTTGAQLYAMACAACHGPDGRGRSQDQVGFDVPLPDFTDCEFAEREPDADWYAVIHEGGPTRGFDEMMPALGAALSGEQIQSVLDHVRSFCTDKSWPRGELNLPRALVTEKAYPEDEAVITTVVAAEGPGSVMNELLYEKRFGARSQIEISVPLGLRDTETEDWEAGFGDLALAVKHTLIHSLASGSIFTLGGEVVLPTGDEERGFGKGTTVLEPFLAFGQILPGEAFVQVQTLGEFPLDSDLESEAAVRAALGRTWELRRFGRAWTPMVEILGVRELESGADTNWDLVPQFQVTLNTRQHVMANLGVRLPLTNADERETEVLFYLLWDWFDGGFFEGW